MRTVLLIVGLVAFSASADDDGYYRRQNEQRQFDQRQFEQQQQRRMQDRIDQRNNDELFNQQQARQRAIYQQGATTAQRNNDMLLLLSLQAGQSKAQRQVKGAICDELTLPREQESDPYLTGYFDRDMSRPYFMTSVRLGPAGSGQRLAFTASLRKGQLPATVKAPLVDVSLYVNRNGAPTTFKAVSGEVTFSSAQQNTARGHFRADMTNVILVEMDGSKQRPGGGCLHAASFWVDGSWSSQDR